MGKTFTKRLLNFSRLFIGILLLLHASISFAHIPAKTAAFTRSSGLAIDQTITFNDIAPKVYTDGDFSPGATASSQLPVTYISSNPTVARVINNGTTIRIVGAGETVITAEQPGNAEYNRAIRVSKALIVNKADLTVTAVNQTRLYGAANAALRFTYAGLRTGEIALSPQPTISTTARIESAVGVYPITIRAATNKNYNITVVNGTITINPATLTIRADNKTKAYGANIPTLTVTYAGFKNNDNVTKLTTRPVITTTAVRASEPGVYPITVIGASSGNYNINYVDGTLTVGRATLTVTVTAKTKTYGANLPALTYTITGFAQGQTAAILTSPVAINTTAQKESPVGVYPITASGAAAENYDFKYVQSNLRVNKANLAIRAENKTRTYGSQNPELTVAYSGFVLGETASVLTSQPIVTTTADSASKAGNYPIRVTGAAAESYNITYTNAVLTVSKAPLRIVAVAETRAYGSENPPFSVTYTGFVNGENETVLTQLPTIKTTATAKSPVGRYSITPSGATAVNYAITHSSAPLTITKATLTITANDVARLYGATTPAFTITYTGFVNSETQGVLARRPSLTSPGTATSPAGTYTITPAGAIASNYDLVYQTGTLIIEKRVLTVTAANKAKTYGQPNPTLTATYTGLVNNERASVILTGRPEFTTTATTASVPGTYPIEIDGDLSADNYEIKFVNGTLTVDNALLTVTVNSITKTYGQAIPRLRYTITGYVNGDNESVFEALPSVPVTTATAESKVGNYNITTGGASVREGYYDIKYVAGRLTIVKAPLNVRATNQTSVYGQPLPAFNYTISGLVNNDNQEAAITKQPVITTAATSSSPVGTYTLQGAGATADNYTFNYIAGRLTITPASLTIKVNDTTRRYAQPNPQFTASYVGLSTFDTPASLTSLPVFNTTANVNSAPGTYAVTAGGASSPNYNISYENGTLTVAKPQLIVKAVNQLRNYGEASPAFTLSYSGFVGNDNETVFTELPKAVTAATQSSNAGTYSIVPSGGVNQTYDVVYENGTLTVNKVNLTVTAKDTSRLYGVANPVFRIKYAGFVNGDSEASLTVRPVVTSTAVPTSPLGTYPLVPAGGASVNYNLNYVNGNLSILPGTSTISFAAIPQKTYGDAAFDAGAVSNVNEQVVYTSNNLDVAAIVNNRIQIKGVGTAVITAALLPGSNYAQTLPVSQTLTVTKAMLAIKANNQSRVYGSANPAFSLAYSGFVNNENQSVLKSPVTASTSATTSSNAGAYPITLIGAAADNYDIAYTAGTLTVSKATLTVTAKNATRAYGLNNPTFEVVYTGFVNGDTQAALTVQPTASSSATVNSPIGTYAIVPNGGAATNYDFSYINGTLTISGGAATIVFNALPVQTFGNPDFDPAASNNVGESIVYSSGNPSVATIVNGRIRITGAGTTIITAAFGPASGYTKTQPQTQLLVVNKAQQAISFKAIPILSRGENYSLQDVTATSGLPVNFTSADASLVAIQGQLLNARQIGSTFITATQAGNNNYLPATAIVRNVEVKNTAGKIEIEVHQAVSPNGDGINDVFFIEGINKYPGNKVTVYNRNGVKIFEVDGYDNVSKVFNGRSNINGQLQQAGTYFYVIQFMAGDAGRRASGAFVLKY
ncbi:T9SS type B sorting domain-containing protein [Mucilaginibacter sp. HME9299]|uniref:T9SS type B sorting domain-containing protein n=1 Tax=Mucilaginibacter aquatilis TaxID=1517760 RepID=A0A6I4I620_9SPHI|nr:T9SS type B sorting domain-containing protein [Mucilaginibacter aquatilis]